MKKIAILQDYLRNGGTERQSLHLARTFAGAGREVTLITFRPGGALAPRAQSATANFKTLTLQPLDTRLDFFAPGLHGALRRLAPDIVLCMGRMANCKAGRIARAFPSAAVISTMRTGKTLPAAYARSLRVTRHTIANSHEAARILRETHAVPAEKITVIHNAVVCDAPPDRVARASSPCGSGGTGFQPVSHHGQDAHATQPLRLVCCAMFRPEKNQRELIEIISKLPASLNVRIDFVGDGSELPACRALAQKLGIADRAHFHGFAANSAPFYQHAAGTIAVLASRSESLPNFLVEAHAHGIPSVAYAVGGVAECGGIAITPGDQTAFLDALTRLVADHAFHAAESARVAARAREQFSPETQLARYLALFDRLA